VQELADSFVERRWIDAGPNGLAGRRIDFPGLQLTITDVLVRAELLDGRSWSTIIHPSQPYFEMAAPQSHLAVMRGYVVHGIRHISLGADHLLFLLGLLLIVENRWMLVKTVSAFTVAHSITLALATLGTPVPRSCRSTPPLLSAFFFLGRRLCASGAVKPVSPFVIPGL
jgi:hypothetical protein